MIQMRAISVVGLLCLAASPNTSAAPKLLSVTPANGTTGVDTKAKVIFTFDSAMEPNPAIGGAPGFVVGGISITGSGADLFWTYAFSGDGKTITATNVQGMTANSKIVWELNASGVLGGFELVDTDGVEVANTSGSFTTGTGTVAEDPCGGQGGGSKDISTCIISVSSNHLQTGPDAVVPNGEDPYTVVYAATSKAPQAFTSVSLISPANQTLPLESVFAGTYFGGDNYATEAQAQAALPPGRYTWRLARGGATTDLAVTVPANQLAVPRISNLSEAWNFDTTRDLTLRWNGLSKPTDSDFSFLSISDAATGKEVYPKPTGDPCKPSEFKPLGDSVVIPANCMEKGKKYKGVLSYSKYYLQDTTTLADTICTGAYSRTTCFDLGAVGPAQPPVSTSLPKIRPIWSKTNGFSLELSGPANSAYAVQRSQDLKSWSAAGQGSLPASGSQLLPLPGASNREFFRAITP